MGFAPPALVNGSTRPRSGYDAARYELSSLYDKYANQNFLSFEDYLELLENWD